MTTCFLDQFIVAFYSIVTCDAMNMKFQFGINQIVCICSTVNQLLFECKVFS